MFRFSYRSSFFLFFIICFFLSFSSVSLADFIGLNDAEFTKDDGYQQIEVLRTSNNGYYAVGDSVRFAGAVSKGNTFWVYDFADGTQNRVGFYDAEHTSDTGRQGGDFEPPMLDKWFLTDSGYAVGYSWRYNGGGSTLGYSLWAYDISNKLQAKVGYYDAAHLKDDNSVSSEVKFLTESGYVGGFSKRYDGGAAQKGQTAWLYDFNNVVLRKVGLYDAEHTKDDASQHSLINDLSEDGYAGGYSYRYNGGAIFLGSTAWVYDVSNNNHIEVGFYTPEFTSGTGYQFSTVSNVSDAYAIGYSLRYNGAGPASEGKKAWIYDIAGATHRLIGLYDAEHLNDNGYPISEANIITDIGYAAGQSYRYNGGAADLGRTAWIYDSINTSQSEVGLYDAEHTKDDGYQNSQVKDMTESGYVYGQSIRYNGNASDRGRTAWIYDIPNATQMEIGYYDAEHTKDDGTQYSELAQTLLKESGYAIGYSTRYNGTGLDKGTTAWLYYVPDTSIVKLGLRDVEHTKADGTMNTSVNAITDSGYVYGYSNRYMGTASDDLGFSAWVYTVATDTHAVVGIKDVEHTRSDGRMWSSVVELTESGYVGGTSKRYNGGFPELGETAWLYHIPTARQVSFDFGEEVGTGEGYSAVVDVLEDGTVFGAFWHLDQTQHIDGSRAFRGDIEGTKEDLFEVVGGDILNYHFEKNNFNIYVTSEGKYLYGDGRLWTNYHTTDSKLAFLLVLETADILTPAAQNSNQAALAEVLDEPNSYVGANAVFYQYLLNYSTGDNVDDTLQQMIPQAASYASTVGLGSMQLVLDVIASNNFSTMGFLSASTLGGHPGKHSGAVSGNSSGRHFGQEIGYQGELNQETSGLSDSDMSLYGKYIYSKGSQNGDSQHDGYDYSSNGITFGADFMRGDSGFWGLAIGYLETDVDGERSTGEIDQTSFAPNAYLALARGKWKLNAGAGYGLQKNESKRFCGISEVGNVEAKWNSHAFTMFAGASYSVRKTEDFSLDVVGGLDYMFMRSEAYTEEGAQLWNMQIDSNNTDSFRSRMGLVFAKDNRLGKCDLKTQVRAFWLHSYLNENSTTVNSFNGSSSFTIDGLSLDRDRLQLGVSFDLGVSDHIDVFLTYDNQLSENAEQHEINTGLRYSF